MGVKLTREPETDISDLSELIGIANAIEKEAVERYGSLATEMERLGAQDTAATFHALQKEELKHVDHVSDWAKGLGEAIQPEAQFVWRLPEDLASSWEELAGSALLTPYRALAIAVTNEERAFAYYAYIAAHADDRQIAKAAEEMAREELSHAMHLRILRRRAYHEERSHNARPEKEAVSTVEEFRDLVGKLRGEAAQRHATIATALREIGDVTSASLLVDLATEEDSTAGNSSRPVAVSGNDEQRVTAVMLIHRAKEPLERLADICEKTAASAASEALLSAAQETLSETVARLARIAHRAEQLE
ncbi:ferritin-like domain-containing protein [Aestuariispira ectoiniformans]|uniref:ferritin-like domain-containing protein n=1 Tax=Aestuariispira ectoiniformans TaxID=2775080 RepID=UPI00223B915F|nr:ferritin family protein [Aestuariispira ectoiniformans]